MPLTSDQIQQASNALQLLGGFLPKEVQPYVTNVAIDGPLGFAAYSQIKDAIAKFPPRNVRTVVSIVEAFGIPAGTPAHTVAELIDRVEQQVEALQAAAAPSTPTLVPTPPKPEV